MVMGGYRLAHLIERPYAFVLIIQSAVAGRQHNFVVLEYGMLLKLSCECLGRVNAVEHPKRMTQHVSKLRRGKWKLLLRSKRIEEAIDVTVM